jgi:YggT family protein
VIYFIYQLLQIALNLITVILIVYVVLSWLFAFDVVSRGNAFIDSIWTFARRVTDPILAPVRRLIPPIAGVDLSVLVVLLVIRLIAGPVLNALYLALVGRGLS